MHEETNWTHLTMDYNFPQIIILKYFGFSLSFFNSRKCVENGLSGASAMLASAFQEKKTETLCLRIPLPLELVNKRDIYNMWKAKEKGKPLISKGKTTQIIGSSSPRLLGLLLRVTHHGAADAG